MFELPLHLGIEHPDVLWIAVPGLFLFAAGLGIGLFADADHDAQPDPVAERDE